ncbi:MAG: prepilin-type N-terminal cleavage/methylation domain-containing protein [Candidatus Omnitrophica bacterium]|nr:prepilin-type N-terminal cleavage/methylation domain-containing protein [Candidatus Omnitrophota bacterium]
MYNAFTLIEMLIVTALLCVISLGIYSTFNNGIKIWQRLNKEVPEQDLYIFFDKFASDLRNSLKFKGINFSGMENQLDFAAIVNSPRLRKRTVGSISYFYDPKTGSAYKEERDFACVYAGARGVVREVLKNIKSLEFKYYSYDIERKEYIWQDRWLKENLPLAVWLEVEITDGDKVFKFSKTVNIPIAG